VLYRPSSAALPTSNTLSEEVELWSCSCQLNQNALDSPLRCLVVFIYTEADMALTHGSPLVGESERCGPLSREDAERQQREVRRIHEALLDRVGHLSPLRPGETPGYARQMLRPPVGGHSEGGEASPAVLYVREDYQIKPHGQVWEGSAAMARWICTQHGRLFVHTGQRGEEADPLAFLELGSGCGLPGLVLAALGYTVVLSDRSQGALVNLVHNVKINLDLFKVPPVIVHLDWSQPASMRQVWSASQRSLHRFDFVIGTEVIYSEQGAEDLIRTVKTWCRPKPQIQTEDLHDHGEGGSFFLLQNRFRAGFDHFLKIMYSLDDSKRGQELGKGLEIEVIKLEENSPHTSPMQLYRVRCVQTG